MSGIFRLNGFTLGGKGYRNHRKPVDIVETPGRTIYRVTESNGMGKRKSPGFMELKFRDIDTVRLPITHIDSDLTIDWGDGTVETIDADMFLDRSQYTNSAGTPLGDFNTSQVYSPPVKHTYSSTQDRVVTITGGLIDMTQDYSPYNDDYKIHPEMSVKYNRHIWAVNYHATEWNSFRDKLVSIKISGMSQLRRLRYAFYYCDNIETVDLNDWDSSGVVDFTGFIYQYSTVRSIKSFNAEFMIWNADAKDSVPRFTDHNGDDGMYQKMYGVNGEHGQKLDVDLYFRPKPDAVVNTRKWITLPSTRKLNLTVSVGYFDFLKQLDFSEWDLKGADEFVFWGNGGQQIELNLPAQPELKKGFLLDIQQHPHLTSIPMEGWDMKNIGSVTINRCPLPKLPTGDWHLAENLKKLFFDNMSIHLQADAFEPIKYLNVSSLEYLQLRNTSSTGDMTAFDFNDVTGNPGELSSLVFLVSNTNFKTLDLTGLTATDPYSRSLHMNLNSISGMTDLHVGENLRAVNIDLQRNFALTTIHGKLWLEYSETHDDEYYKKQSISTFGNTTSLANVDFSKFDLSGFWYLQSLFNNTSVLTSGHSFMSGMDMSQVAILRYAFSNCELNTAASTWLAGWNVSIPTSPGLTDETYGNFIGSWSGGLEGVFGNTTAHDLDLSGWDVDHGAMAERMFENATITGDLDISTWDFEHIYDMESCFAYMEVTGDFKLSNNIKFSGLQNAEGMFNNGEYDINMDGSNINFSMLDTAQRMFYGFRGNLNIHGSGDWSFPKLTSMGFMFMNCCTTSDFTFEMDNWSFGDSTINAYSIFNSCKGGTQIQQVSGWSDFKPDNVTEAFRDTDIEEMDLSNWDMSKLDDSAFGYTRSANTGGLYRMFRDCRELTSIDVSWATASESWNIATIKEMFRDCWSLTTITGMKDWDMSCVANYTDSYPETFTVGSTVNPNLGYFRNVFYRCDSLTSLDLSGWCVDGVEPPAVRVSGADVYKVGASGSTSVGAHDMITLHSNSDTGYYDVNMFENSVLYQSTTYNGVGPYLMITTEHVTGKPAWNTSCT